MPVCAEASFRVHEDAARELSDAAEYYDLESPGLGAVFVSSVDDGFVRIREYPDAAREVAHGVRGLVLAKFPYTVIYEVRDDTIRVLAIAHQRRRPFHWRGRR